MPAFKTHIQARERTSRGGRKGNKGKGEGMVKEKGSKSKNSQRWLTAVRIRFEHSFN